MTAGPLLLAAAVGLVAASMMGAATSPGGGIWRDGCGGSETRGASRCLE